MLNQYLLYNNNKLDLGTVKQKLSVLPTTGINDMDKFWYTLDNSIYIYNYSNASWTVKTPVNGLKFLLEKNADGTANGKTYVCFNGLFTDITAGSDATTVNGHTVESDVPLNAIFTDTIYNDTAIKQDISNLQTDSHTHPNKTTIDKFGEDVNGNPTYDGNPIGGSGTTDYVDLINKPSIGGIELSGNKTLANLGIQPSGSYLVASDIVTKLDATNIHAGSNVNLTKVGNDVTINSTATSGSTVTDSTTNGNIVVDGSELIVYELPLDVAKLSDIPNVSNKLDVTNIKAGTDITLNKIGNDVIINSTAISGSVVTDSTTNGNILIDNVETTVYTLPSDIARLTDIPDVSAKLEASNLEAGSNITIVPNGSNLVINANSSAVDTIARQDIATLTTTVNGKAPTVHTHAISDVINLQTSLDNKVDDSQVGAINGIATLGADGKVTSAQLPSTYQLTLGDLSTNAYYGDKGKIAYDHSQKVTGNPHSVTKSDVGLSNVANTDTTTTANISDSLDKRFITDGQKTVLNNTSGTNSGDETSSTIKTKIGSSSTTTDGYLTSTDFTKFNNKVDSVVGSSLVQTTEIAKIHNASLLGTKTLDETNISDKKVIMYDNTTGTLVFDDVAIPTSTDQDATEIATIITDIETTTNSTPLNTVGTLRDLRNVVKEIYPLDKTSTVITDIVSDIQATTDTTTSNTVSTLKDLRDVVKGNNTEINNTIESVTTDKIANRLSYFDIGQDSTIGSIITILGNTPPQHYLKMDGTVYNIADYPDLATFFQTQFGTKNYFGGDGTTTFAVPDSIPSETNAINCIKYEKIFYLSGVKSEVIFDGNVVKTGTGTITNAYNIYKFLVIEVKVVTSHYKYLIIPVDSIVLNKSIMDSILWMPTLYSSFRFLFTSTTSFYYPDGTYAGNFGNITISKIYGLY